LEPFRSPFFSSHRTDEKGAVLKLEWRTEQPKAATVGGPIYRTPPAARPTKMTRPETNMKQPWYMQRTDSAVVVKLGRRQIQITGIEDLGLDPSAEIALISEGDGLYRFLDDNGKTSRTVRPTIIRDYSLD